MVLLIILLIIILLGTGGYIGYRLGTYYVNKENVTLRNQLMLQERFSRTWAAEATDKYTLTQQIAEQQIHSVRDNMQLIIALLGRVEQQEAHNMGKEEKEKINRLISEAKQIHERH